MPRVTKKAIEKYLLEDFRNSVYMSDLFTLVSDILLIFIGTVLLSISLFSEQKLATIFFAISVILGFWAFDFHKHVIKYTKLILRETCYNSTFIDKDVENRSKYATYAHVFTVVAGCFGMFGMLCLLF